MSYLAQVSMTTGDEAEGMLDQSDAMVRDDVATPSTLMPTQAAG